MRAVVLAALLVMGAVAACATESASLSSQPATPDGPEPQRSSPPGSPNNVGNASEITAACDYAAQIGCEGTVKCCFPSSDVDIKQCLTVARLLCNHEARKRVPSGERAPFDTDRAEVALIKLAKAFTMCPVSLGPESTSLLADAEWAAGRRPLPIDAACTGTQCDPTGWCDAGRCKARLARGASCDDHARCAKGEYCSTLTHVCEAPGALGAVCDPKAPWDERCADGAFCMDPGGGRASVCAPMLPVGAACASRHDCMSQACSGGDAGTGVCLTPQESDLCRKASVVLHPRPR
ncbi:MAG: hypothetical protein JWM74_5415 [Myxococcaceae bacterium]|nr:hypothetical protein [Myxococcaceae bacterium]